jgi:hypothetical protein
VIRSSQTFACTGFSFGHISCHRWCMESRWLPYFKPFSQPHHCKNWARAHKVSSLEGYVAILHMWDEYYYIQILPFATDLSGDAWKADGYPTLSPTLSPEAVPIAPEPTKSPVWKGRDWNCISSEIT